MTSAPRSERVMEQKGPARTLLRSRMRTPFRGGSQTASDMLNDDTLSGCFSLFIEGSDSFGWMKVSAVGCSWWLFIMDMYLGCNWWLGIVVFWFLFFRCRLEVTV